MGQPNPPGDNVPLYEGLSAEWNDIVSAIPEDKRAEIAPLLKSRVDSFEPLKQWEDFTKSGITRDHAETAMNIYSMIENDPRRIYDAIGDHLGLTKAEKKELADEVKKVEETGSDSEIQALKEQIDVLSQIALAQRQQTTQEKQAAEEDARLNSEIEGIKSKYGNDVPEDEILMRMLHKGMTAEQAYVEYNERANSIRSRRPAPVILGTGGAIPNSRAIDVKKLDNAGTKNLVAQMIQQAAAEK
jgi:hypothetical protein